MVLLNEDDFESSPSRKEARNRLAELDIGMTIYEFMDYRNRTRTLLVLTDPCLYREKIRDVFKGIVTKDIWMSVGEVTEVHTKKDIYWYSILSGELVKPDAKRNE